MVSIFQRINILKEKSFIDWPTYLQRFFLIFLSFLLFLVLNNFLFSTSEQTILGYRKNINVLTQKLEMQQELIKQVKIYSQQNIHNTNNLLSLLDTLNFSSFMVQLSILSKQNHLEIQEIKPLALKNSEEETARFVIHPFQIIFIGKYSDLLAFMHHFIMLTMMEKFQMSVMPTGDFLKLVVLVDLYVRRS